MRSLRQFLWGLAGALAIGMVAAIFAAAGRLDDVYKAYYGVEIFAMAALILPWCAVLSRRAASHFDSQDKASGAWNALAVGGVLLAVGNVIGFLPSFVALGATNVAFQAVAPWATLVSRALFCWALLRMRNAYLETGLEFSLTAVDKGLSTLVAIFSLFMLSRYEVLFAHWTFGNPLPTSVKYAITAAQILNFLIYPAVFFLGVTMYRYATQMGGGLVARAWGSLAVYAVLQSLHAFLIAIVGPSAAYAPLYELALDNFIVLVAYTALAVGPTYQIEAARWLGRGAAVDP